MENTVDIKGIREGLLVDCGEGEWSQVKEQVLGELNERSQFLAGAKIVLDVQDHALGAAEMGKLRDQVEDLGLSLWAVLSRSEQTERSAQALGLATRIHQNNSPLANGLGGPSDGNADAVFIEKTIRSGSKLSFPGNVTIFGDVNPGAEIIASGHIIVWGRLRGMVHAGAEGDTNAKVCALDLSPTQLRIADQIAVPPERKEDPQPEIAFLRDGQLQAEIWKLSNGLR